VAILVVAVLIDNVFDLGPHWVESSSPSGIDYACMYESKADFELITLEYRSYYHDR
jgi:hypothetical protein